MDIARHPRRPTPGQRALAERLATGLAAIGDHVETLSARVYLDEDRYAAEQRALFDRLPLPIAPSALLPSASQAVAHDGYGLPLIISRDAKGKAHVLANVCRHRGTRLLSTADVVPAKRIICPYHAWAYHPDGQLAGLPRADCFPGMDKADHGLVELASVEAGGMIWFAKDPDADFSDARALAPDFDAFGIDELYLYERRTHDVPANWKLIMDAFNESYHVQRLHASSIAQFFADGFTAVDQVGRHNRIVVGRSDYLQEIDRDDWAALRRAVTYTYQLLPSTVMIVSPDYINLLVMMPQSVGRTLVEDFMLIPEKPMTNEAEAHWRRSWELLDGQTFGDEDFGAAAQCHLGLASGLVKDTVLGTLEAGIADFHRQMDAEIQSVAGK